MILFLAYKTSGGFLAHYPQHTHLELEKEKQGKFILLLIKSPLLGLMIQEKR